MSCRGGVVRCAGQFPRRLFGGFPGTGWLIPRNYVAEAQRRLTVFHALPLFYHIFVVVVVGGVPLVASPKRGVPERSALIEIAVLVGHVLSFATPESVSQTEADKEFSSSG